MIFDEQENAGRRLRRRRRRPFPAEAQPDARWAATDLPVPSDVRVDVPEPEPEQHRGRPESYPATRRAQAWVTVMHRRRRPVQRGLSATQLDNATAASHFVPGP